MEVSANARTVSRYWQLTFPEAGEEEPIPEADAATRLRALLSDATRLRLRADVTVGGYLSGGLDSTYITALIREHTPEALSTFSIAFEDPAYDERSYQELATSFLGTAHRRTLCTNAEIGRVLPDVIWHTEAPILRTSPAPMYLLSRLVRENGIKVVLTGEGSDEFLGGYNIYKEDKVRRFWAREPDSMMRPRLLRRLYPYIADLARGGDAYLAAFFGRGLTDVDRPGYSHRLRWEGTSRLRNFLSPDVHVPDYEPVAELLAGLDGALSTLSPLAQAQTLEVRTFMSPYLLSSQGDRMMAANSVEGRFPFLDHRVVEFASRLSPQLKIRGLREKHILKASAEGFLPPAIIERHKQPYRAPIHGALFNQPLDYVAELLSPDALRAGGVFAPEPVDRLMRKYRRFGRLSEFEDMALIGVLTTQLLIHQFVQHFDRSVPEVEPVRICQGEELHR
jgi:asparagine synthase (glutamine-hydrolysing)